MKKHYNLLFILLVPALFILVTAEMMYPTGSPGGKTGSPGDEGANCTECHEGTPQNQDTWVFLPELILQGYNPGQTYGVSVIGQGDTDTFGFEVTAEDASDNKVGSFTDGGLGNTQVINDNSAVTHTLQGSTSIIPGGTAWNFFWTAPNESAGDITFYAAINVANGNGANTGDQINLTQFMVSPATAVGENTSKNSFGLYPNPSTGVVHLDASQSSSGSQLELFTLGGQLVYRAENVQTGQSIDLSDIEKGMYIARMDDKTQRLILR